MPVFEPSFWDNAQDIRIYLKLRISVVRAISIYAPPFLIRLIAENSLAEALLVSDISIAWIGVKPALFAAIPSVNDTAKYPSATGIP